MFASAPPLAIDNAQKARLEALARAGPTPQKLARQCRVILLASQGVANRAIAQQTGLSRPTVIATRATFAKGGLTALRSVRQRKRSRPVLTPTVEQQILDATLKTRPADGTHWSVRGLAQHLGLSRMMVQRVWARHNLQPHRVEKFKLLERPPIRGKSPRCGRTVPPPAGAGAGVERRRKEPDPSVGPHGPDSAAAARPAGAADARLHAPRDDDAVRGVQHSERQGDWHRVPRHRGREFVRFLAQLDKEVPPELDVHLIVDNYSTHKSDAVTRWLSRKGHQRFHLHFTPTSSSWLNQVERWFGLITERMIRRGTFHSVHELEQAIYQWLATWNERPQPFVWTATADVILEKVRRCKESVGTAH